ncbi:DUF4124 domain-containing protein [Azospira sp. I13]|uniref:DUF4124 domain-containing protein n=1 Tax=Azospira sp. I13 TaxID=1765050 RepID=UPI000D5A154E|nr:DUF4124 domain-containing protein [Azospira sp. I13]
MSVFKSRRFSAAVWFAGMAAFGLSTSAAMAGGLYTWKDENGLTVMSDKPPVGKNQQKRVINVPEPTSPAAPPKTFADREMEFRRDQQARQEKAKKADEEKAQAAKNKEGCESARRNLQLYQSGERIARRTDSGEREFLDEDQRAAEAAKAQKAVNEWCR